MKKVYNYLIILTLLLLSISSYSQQRGGDTQGGGTRSGDSRGGTRDDGPGGGGDHDSQGTTFYRDADGDGWGNPNDSILVTQRGGEPQGYISRSGDCDDTNANIHPETNWYLDFDQDNFGSSEAMLRVTLQDHREHDNTAPAILTSNPGRDWVDITATTYTGCTPPSDYSYSYVNGDCNNKNRFLYPGKKWYRDADNDHYGTSTDIKTQCLQPTGYVENGGDCDDTNDQFYPNKKWYQDSDNDGWGVTSISKIQCTQPNGYVSKHGDCDDTQIDHHPEQVWYRDADTDDWGTNTDTKIQCTPPTGYILRAGDCDDTKKEIHPETIWYSDTDGDNFGEEGRVTKQQCTKPIGFTNNNNDLCPNIAGRDQGCPSYDYTPPNLSDENYIYTRTPQKAITNLSQIDKLQDVIEEVTYFDGFGRPAQQIGIRHSPNFNDIIQHIGYNKIGQQDKAYLPHVENNGDLTGSYRKSNQATATQQYYKVNYPSDFENVPLANVNSYSQSQFEKSPIGRLEKQAAPGKDWAIGNGHEIKFEYQTNTLNEVKAFTVSLNENYIPTLNNTVNFYPKGSLSKKVTKDENWVAGLDHTTEEFTDKQDRIILKRTYDASIAHDTYYVYDDFGNLTYVLPPKVITSDGVSDSELNELCYQYIYDHRNRLVEKKIPGKGWEYIVYNKLDQPVMAQNANQRVKKEWLFTKYDALGRVAFTGLHIHPSVISRTAMQGYADNRTDQWVSKTTTINTISGTQLYYTNDALPTGVSEIYTISYYDDYEVPNIISLNPSNTSISWEGMIATSNVQGLPTVSQVKVLETDQWITTTTYYDKKGRAWETHVKNDYLGTEDWVLNKLDFTGKTIQTTSIHKKNETFTNVTDIFTYDHVGRPLTQIQKINDQEEERIVGNTYDQLGQLTNKEIGGFVGRLGLQSVAYSYNVRGWLTAINDPTHLNGSLFAFGITYNTPTHGATALFNGNIAETQWKTANDNSKRWYTYEYDALNRITQGSSSDGKYNLSGVTYDKIGNILTLQRTGAIVEDVDYTNPSHFDTMDNLTYQYDTGNKLQNMTDQVTLPFGFKKVNSSIATNTYNYDDNGNMTLDPNKGITEITYNHLNLPKTVTINNTEHTGDITYIYDALGTKLKKMVTEGGSLTTTEYAGNYIYKNGILEFFNHPEGYIEPTVTADGIEKYTYVYQYKDHLGNIRLSYTDADKDGNIAQSEIVQEKNYYPFGMTHSGYNNTLRGRNHNYGFGNKEEQDELNLGWIDITARNYDPTLGRWMNIDPLADQMRRHSPYNYAFGNPIYFIDPDGNMPCPNGDCSQIIAHLVATVNAFLAKNDVIFNVDVGADLNIGFDARVDLGDHSGNLNLNLLKIEILDLKGSLIEGADSFKSDYVLKNGELEIEQKINLSFTNAEGITFNLIQGENSFIAYGRDLDYTKDEVQELNFFEKQLRSTLASQDIPSVLESSNSSTTIGNTTIGIDSGKSKVYFSRTSTENSSIISLGGKAGRILNLNFSLTLGFKKKK